MDFNTRNDPILIHLIFKKGDPMKDENIANELWHLYLKRMKYKMESLKSKNIDTEEFISETLNFLDEIDLLFRLAENFPFNKK